MQLVASRGGGLDASLFERVGDTASNSSRLGGLDASSYQHALQTKVVSAPFYGAWNIVTCPDGWWATGGGYHQTFITDDSTRDWVDGSEPYYGPPVSAHDVPIGWEASVEVVGFQDGGTVYAVCQGPK